MEIHGGFIEAKSNFRGLSWTFSPKYAWKHWLASHAITGTAWRNRAAAWGALSLFQRCAPYSMKIGLRKMHERGLTEARTTSVSVPYACRQSGPEAGRNKFFSGSDGGLGKGIWTSPGLLVYVSTCHSQVSPQVQRWPLWILCEYSKLQPAWCAPPLLLYSTQHLVHWPQQLAEGIPLSYEDIIMDHGWPVPGADLARAAWEGVSFKTDSMAKKVELCGDRMRIIWHTDWAGAVKVVLLIDIQPSSAARLSEFSPYFEPPFQVSSRLHSRLCGDQRDASLQLSLDHRRDNNVVVFELTLCEAIDRFRSIATWVHSNLIFW